MLTMGISGSILASRHSLTNTNVLGGFVAVYFVATALTTVRPVALWTSRLNATMLVVGIALVAMEIVAVGSFFSIPARVARILPQAFATPAMRTLPIALVLVAMFYWLWRVRGRRLPVRHG